MKKIMVLFVLSILAVFAFNLNVKAEVNDYNFNSAKYNVKMAKEVSDFNPDMGQFNSGFGNTMSCKELLGSSLVKFLKTVRVAVQSIGVAIAIANGMMTFVPAITSKDASALNKAFEKFVKLLVILACLLLLPTLINFIGGLAGFDLSCL